MRNITFSADENKIELIELGPARSLAARTELSTTLSGSGWSSTGQGACARRISENSTAVFAT